MLSYVRCSLRPFTGHHPDRVSDVPRNLSLRASHPSRRSSVSVTAADTYSASLINNRRPTATSCHQPCRKLLNGLTTAILLSFFPCQGLCTVAGYIGVGTDLFRLDLRQGLHNFGKTFQMSISLKTLVECCSQTLFNQMEN